MSGPVAGAGLHQDRAAAGADPGDVPQAARLNPIRMPTVTWP